MKNNRLLIALILGLGALGMLGLRFWQLTRCLDETGLVRYGSKSDLILSLWGVLVTGLLAWRTTVSNKVKGRGDCITGSTPAGLLQLVGGLGLGAGALLLIGAYTPAWGNSVVVLTALAGLLLAVAGVFTVWGRTPPMPLYLIAAAALTAFALLNFQAWNLNPGLAGFGLELAALAAFGLAVFNQGGFGVDQGLTRSSLFFAGMGLVFTTGTLGERLALLVKPALPGNAVMSLPHVLIMVGAWAWCLGAVLLLLRRSVQEREEPATAEVSEETPEEDPDLEA